MTRLDRLAREAGFRAQDFTDAQILTLLKQAVQHLAHLPRLRAEGLDSWLDVNRDVVWKGDDGL